MAALFGGAEVIMTGTSWVTIVAAPAGGKQRQVLGICASNRDTVQRTIKLRKNKGSGTTLVVYPSLDVPAGLSALMPFDSIVLDAADELLEMSTDATAATTEPNADACYFEVP
jgi:hypothetical protein